MKNLLSTTLILRLAVCGLVCFSVVTAQAADKPRLFRRLCMPIRQFRFEHYVYVVGLQQNLITEDLSLLWTRDGTNPPHKGWDVADGKLHRAKGTGDLISKRDYKDFILEFSWTIQEGGNSGIKYRLAQYPKTEQTDLSGWLGIEYQILDDFHNGEGKSGSFGSTASFYHIKAPNNRKSLNPHDQINHGKIVVRGNTIEHWLNGECVGRMMVGSKDWKDSVASGKFKDVLKFAENRGGRLLVQDHGSEVTFHTLTIRELTLQPVGIGKLYRTGNKK
ncbi:MAG: DUF1080 domain-containing protein [Planctomycetaceae bacterium]|nr:DUF1080 domain-containing protein [Planctomycetaceae bacterium]